MRKNDFTSINFAICLNASNIGEDICPFLRISIPWYPRNSDLSSEYYLFLLTRYAIYLKVTLAMENGHHGENALLLVAWVVGHDFEHALAAVQDQMLIWDHVISKTALVGIFFLFIFFYEFCPSFDTWYVR